MLSDQDLGFLSSAGIEFGTLVPTATGLEKGIMDATSPLRKYLKSVEYHDFDSQEQGVITRHEITYYDHSRVRNLVVSLYRPRTKNGDPRIWISNLRSFADPDDVLVLIVYNGLLVVYNSTKMDLRADLANHDSLLHTISRDSLSASPVSDELLSKIEGVFKKGFIPSMKRGDTGVGYTLETLLGIEANSRRGPDYKGIELKATRTNRQRNHQLFSKCPDWGRSRYSAWDTLMKFGSPTTSSSDTVGIHRLYCTVQSSPPNPHGFFLRVEANDQDLWAHNLKTDEDVFVWGLDQLKAQLTEKHRETFWVKAESRGHRRDGEYFLYSRVVHTRNPSVTAFERLLSLGGVKVDLTMKVRDHQNRSVRDHGYLFKVTPNRFYELFPVIRDVDFTTS